MLIGNWNANIYFQKIKSTFESVSTCSPFACLISWPNKA